MKTKTATRKKMAIAVDEEENDSEEYDTEDSSEDSCDDDSD